MKRKQIMRTTEDLCCTWLTLSCASNLKVDVYPVVCVWVYIHTLPPPRPPPSLSLQVKPLEEDKAIADGGDLLAEGFIYGLGTFLSESTSHPLLE